MGRDAHGGMFAGSGPGGKGSGGGPSAPGSATARGRREAASRRTRQRPRPGPAIRASGPCGHRCLMSGGGAGGANRRASATWSWSTSALAPARERKSPASAGLFQCAEEDSNLHGEISPQGPQPCASTNSATGAGAAQNYSREGAGRRPLRFRPVGWYLYEHTFDQPAGRPDWRLAADGPDQAPAGDLRLHQALRGRARLPADGARHRQGGRARLVVDGARAPRRTSSASGCCAATRPSRARSSCSTSAAGTITDAVRNALGGGGLPLVGSVAAGQPILAEENIEEYIDRCPRSPAASDGEYILRVRGDSMVDAGMLEGDFVVVKPQETADRRRDRRRAGRGGGDGQALLPRDRPRPPAAGEPDDGADPVQGRQGPRTGRRPVQERPMNAAVLDRPRTAFTGSAAQNAVLCARESRADPRGRDRRGLGGPGGPSGRRLPGLRRADGAALRRVGRRAGRRPLHRLRLDARVETTNGPHVAGRPVSGGRRPQMRLTLTALGPLSPASAS